MRTTMTNGFITLIAETVEDTIVLLSVKVPQKSVSITPKVSEISDSEGRRKYRTYTTCEYCKNEFRSHAGIAIHLSKTHGIVGKNHSTGKNFPKLPLSHICPIKGCGKVIENKLSYGPHIRDFHVSRSKDGMKSLQSEAQPGERIIPLEQPEKNQKRSLLRSFLNG